MKVVQITSACKVLREGGVLAYPTESCFGLGCDPSNVAAIKKILMLKRRTRDKGVILIADRFARLSRFLEELPQSTLDKVLRSWPGPNTWLCPSSTSTSRWLRGQHDTLGVRVTAHPFAAQISHQAGMAIVSTSANRANRPSLRTAGAVIREFGKDIDYVVDLPIGSLTMPSTIRHAITNSVIRP